MIGDGYCNDETNNVNCNYDGGDCCSININSEKCTDCICHQLETCAAGNHPSVGDGYCQDEFNNAECNYDGGDCCLLIINPEQCSECVCHIKEQCAVGIMHPSVGDGYCQDEFNNAECNYDFGDCCLIPLNTDYCSICTCSTSSGVIASPGYPDGYDNYIDMSWIIQVSSGQLIRISFDDTFYIADDDNYSYEYDYHNDGCG